MTHPLCYLFAALFAFSIAGLFGLPGLSQHRARVSRQIAHFTYHGFAFIKHAL
ncbi:hypothetical protein [Kluyvera georgiana]|uniref:hypothetical protein n=1 Tax=Kluyvera georgiana TaxID=73098 RepID=UPI003F66DA3F